MRNKPKSIIKKAITILQKFGWTKKALAKDKNGNAVLPSDESAESFCLVGAIERATRDLKYGEKDKFQAIKIVKDVNGLIVLTPLNDAPNTTKKDVINALKKAVEKADEI
jgi:ribosomal protein S5